MPGRNEGHNPNRLEFAAVPLRSSVPSVVVLFVVCWLGALLGCGGPPKHPTWKNATGAEQHERLMWKALRDKDWKEVEYRLASTFVGVIATGQVLDRTGWIDHWKAAQIKEFSMGEMSVQPNGPDMTVTYTLHLAGAANPDLQVVSVWQQAKNGWMLISTSNTPIKEGSP
jgi:hypothetical protein